MTQYYSLMAKGLHWFMAVSLINLLALGFFMHDLPLSPQKLQLYSWHKWAGVTAFLLVVFRLVWRVLHRPPALPESMPRLLQLAAHLGHLTLYVLMFVIPLSGWLMSSAKGFQTVYFGWLPIPDLLGKDLELGKQLHAVHEVLNLVFVVVIAGHIGAALKHHFIDRDDILKRMLPLPTRAQIGELK